VFVVNGRAVTGSQYRLKSMLHVKPDLPSEVREFAERMAALYSPEPGFVMDVSEWRDRLYITELNCFNASGFYACDVRKIVEESSHWIDTDPLMRFFFEPPVS